MAEGRKQPNVAQLRSKIDSGRTGDKVPAADPATSPLGTDDEAAGVPSDRGVDSEAVHRRETTATRLDENRPPIAADSGGLRKDDAQRSPLYVWAGLIGIACIVAVLLAVVAIG